MVQWLRLCTYTARGIGSISGQGTKIPHAAWPKIYMCTCIYIIKFTSPFKYRDLLMKI